MKRTCVAQLALLLLIISCIAPSAGAQVDTEVRRELADLRSDNVKHNCGQAIEKLYPRREELRDALVDELYRTDVQGKRAILFILYNTKSFIPDERFLRTVIQELPADQKMAGRGCGCDLPINWTKDGKLDAIVSRWDYVDQHFELFEPLLSTDLATPTSSWMIWATAWIFKKHGVFESKLELFKKPEVFSVCTANLVDDNVSFNAAGSIRFFLIMGERSVPALKAALQSRDGQTRYLAKATLDALKGERRGFGYLGSKVNLSETLIGPWIVEPDWMPDLVEQYVGKDSYP